MPLPILLTMVEALLVRLIAPGAWILMVLNSVLPGELREISPLPVLAKKLAPAFIAAELATLMPVPALSVMPSPADTVTPGAMVRPPALSTVMKPRAETLPSVVSSRFPNDTAPLGALKVTVPVIWLTRPDEPTVSRAMPRTLLDGNGAPLYVELTVKLLANMAELSAMATVVAFWASEASVTFKVTLPPRLAVPLAFIPLVPLPMVTVPPSPASDRRFSVMS